MEFVKLIPVYVIILIVLYFIVFGFNTMRYYQYRQLRVKYEKAYIQIDKFSPGFKIVRVLEFSDGLLTSMCFLCQNAESKWFKATISYKHKKENLYFKALNHQEVVTLMNSLS